MVKGNHPGNNQDPPLILEEDLFQSIIFKQLYTVDLLSLHQLSKVYCPYHKRHMRMTITTHQQSNANIDSYACDKAQR